jgi:DNA-binding HxlR family transcriptional regulator
MKTGTRTEILRLIEKIGKVRPADLRQSLNISAQAVHRHLRALVEQGAVEAQGSAPFTQYALAGVPDLDAVSRWMKDPSSTRSAQSLVSETREIFTARLPRLKSFLNDGLSEAVLPLVISTTGEVGNNSFDHNLGQWRDVPGCWLESQVSGGRLWICIADRGQGVYQSLIRVHPTLADEQAALKAAFETIISGRAPEQRGNGLKFVRNNLSITPGGGLACFSGTGRVFYGDLGEKCLGLLAKYFTNVEGTITLMTWELK